MIDVFAMAILTLVAVLAAAGVGFAVLIACGLVRHCRAERFAGHADQAIAVTRLWSDEENEILLGERPLL